MAHRPGCSVEVTTSKMIDKIHDMVLSYRRIKVREIFEATGISQGTVFSILHGKLGVEKILARLGRVFCLSRRLEAISRQGPSTPETGNRPPMCQSKWRADRAATRVPIPLFMQRRIDAIVWSTLRLFWRFSVAMLTRFGVYT